MRLLCGDAAHDLVVRETRDGIAVTIGEKRFEVTLEAIAPGIWLLRRDGGQEVFHCVRDGDDVHLFWRGCAYRMALEREGARRSARHAHGGLEAPMPGKVIKLSVREGQAVAKGDEILVVEAMKMENAIRAPRDGRVTRLAAKLGDMVSPGVVLVEIE
jgi:3-methylcrotonyl-CoA carboxylase alpha subunit